MKKTFLLLLSPLILFTACTRYADSRLPPGVWESEDPKIVIDVKPEEKLNPTTYTTEDGLVLSVFTQVDTITGRLVIWDTDSGGANNEYFVGSWKLKDDKIYYKLLSTYRDETGYSQIVFTKTKDYEPPLWPENYEMPEDYDPLWPEEHSTH